MRSADKLLAADGDANWGEVIAETAATTVLGDMAITLGITEFFEADSAKDAFSSLAKGGLRMVGKALTSELTSGMFGDNLVGQVFGELVSKVLTTVIDKTLDAVFESFDSALGAAFDNGFGEFVEDLFGFTQEGIEEESD